MNIAGSDAFVNPPVSIFCDHVISSAVHSHLIHLETRYLYIDGPDVLLMDFNNSRGIARFYFQVS